MLATLIIIFREILEVGLIVGIVLTATHGVPQRARWVAYGLLGGIVASGVVALFADTLGGLMAGVGQELFNATVLLIAVMMLTWHNVWMAREDRHIAQTMRLLGDDVAQGRRTLAALAIVVGIAMLREGSEIVLFLYGIALAGGSDTSGMVIGSIVGLALGACLSAMIYYGLLRVPTRYLFAVTSWMIALIAAGMAAQAILYLEQAGVITALSHIVWDTSAFLSEDSLLGKALQTLIGYTDRPSGMQLFIYLATLVAIFALMKMFGRVTSPLPAKRA